MGTEEAPTAGWYDDPGGSGNLRWWAGTTWTDELREKPQTAPIVIQESAYNEAAFEAEFAPIHSAYEAIELSANTVPVWIIALSPLVYAGVYTLTAGAGIASLVAAVFFVVLVLLVLWDRAALRSQLVRPASGFWILLGPIGYLIARRIAMKTSGIKSNGPGNVFALSVLAGFGLLVAFVLPGQVTSMSADSITAYELHHAADLKASTDLDWSVECAKDVNAAVPGTTFRCLASTTDTTIDFTATVVTPFEFEVVETRANVAS